MRTIICTDEFEGWFGGLDEIRQDAVSHVVELLAIKWLSLGDPYSSKLNGTRIYPLRELKTNQHNIPVRIFYGFSPERNAVLVIGGDKTGNPRFYDEMIPVAERIWGQYLRERASETR